MFSNEEASAPHAPLVVMGVSGAGKTTVGVEIALRLGRPFIDADDLHPQANRRKMESCVPLDDSDREPWLRAVGKAISAEVQRGRPPVVACSALKIGYREQLRAECPDIAFVYLDGAPEIIAARMSGRQHEYMPAELLPSQLRALEPPLGDERAIRIDIEKPVDLIVSQAISWLRTLEPTDQEVAR